MAGVCSQYQPQRLQHYMMVVDMVVQHIDSLSRKSPFFKELHDILSDCFKKNINYIMHALKQAQLGHQSGDMLEKQTDSLMTFITDKILQLQEVS